MLSFNFLTFFALVAIVILKNECVADVDNAELEERKRVLYSSGGECTEDENCPSSEKCVDSSCTHVCLSECFGAHVSCYGVDNTAQCLCESGFLYNSEGICKKACNDSSECHSRAECITDSDGKSKCECKAGFLSDRYTADQCELSHECHDDDGCEDFETCVLGQCYSVCLIYKCSKPHEGCIAKNNIATCICKPGYTRNYKGDCVKNPCDTDSDCGPHGYCVTLPDTRRCICKPNYYYDYSSNGICRQLCATTVQCEEPNTWCNGRFCVPCDGIMC